MKRLVAFAALFAAGAVGCAPAIGDDCGSSLDCSVNGERICDLASPAGYCTIPSCDDGTCPESAVCVEFRFEPARLASTFCMAECEDAADCRGEDGYACVTASSIDDDAGNPLARVIDRDKGDHKFCGATGG
jgi:hypothetical protein